MGTTDATETLPLGEVLVKNPMARSKILRIGMPTWRKKKLGRIERPSAKWLIWP
jgi:hypothetical protein